MNFGFYLYPNPTTGNLKLFVANWFDYKKVELVVVNILTSEVVSSFEMDSSETTFDISHLPAGVYLLSETNLGIQEKIILSR